MSNFGRKNEIIDHKEKPKLLKNTKYNDSSEDEKGIPNTSGKRTPMKNNLSANIDKNKKRLSKSFAPADNFKFTTKKNKKTNNNQEIHDILIKNENSIHDELILKDFPGQDESVIRTIVNSPRSNSFIHQSKNRPRGYYFEEVPFSFFNPFGEKDESIDSDDEEGGMRKSSIDKGKASSLATSFSIWSCMIGSGILSIPWAVKEAGIIPTIFLVLLFGVMNWYTCYIYVKTGLHSKDFSDTVAEYFGRKYGYLGRSLQVIGATFLTLGAFFIFFLIVK